MELMCLVLKILESWLLHCVISLCVNHLYVLKYLMNNGVESI